MEKEEFLQTVTNLVLPLFTGSSVVGEEESNSREAEVAQGTGGTMLLKASRYDEYRFIIKRNQPFKTADVVLVRNILEEVVDIAALNIKDVNYIKKLKSTAIEKAICKAASEEAADTLLELITELSVWGSRTYEGKRPCFGFTINEADFAEDSDHNLHISEIINQDFAALLTNGRQTFLEIDRNGYLIGHRVLERLKFAPTLCPYDFINVARYCTDKRVGLVLAENGDMLIFKAGQLIFSKRRGVWNSFAHEEIIQILSSRTESAHKELRRAIYLTALDISFSGNGGCIAYLSRDHINEVLSHIDVRDLLSQEYYELKRNVELKKNTLLFDTFENEDIENFYSMDYEELIKSEDMSKVAALRLILKDKKFHELNRKLREELVAMDGATIIDSQGTIVAVGAIIKIEAGSMGGGRLAAAKTLARYGSSIKISTDGIIQGFKFDKRDKTAKTVFSIG